MSELRWKQYPVDGLPYNITGNFGDWYGNRYHRGTDIGVVIGTPVYAPADGRSVSVFNPDGSFGRAVCLEHPGTGWFSLYAHLDSAEARPGLWVDAGERIGLSGNTGLSSGPHLHWQVCVDPAMPVDIRLSRDAMKVPFEEWEDEEPMTDDERLLMLTTASIVGGWTNGQPFTTVQEALTQMLIFEGQDQRVLMGMGALGTSIESVATALAGHMGVGHGEANYETINATLMRAAKEIEGIGVSVEDSTPKEPVV